MGGVFQTLEENAMKKCLLVLAAVAAAGAMAADCTPCEKFRPKLFKAFGEEVNVPDGMTQDPAGNIYLSVPNFSDQSYPGHIRKRCAKTGKWSTFCVGRISPITGKGFPMGIEWGPDGNLYYCDNQYFTSKDYASRIMKVTIDPKTGEAGKIEPVVTGIKLANAIRFFGNELFFTDTFFDLPGDVGIGGVYRVPMKDFAEKPVALLPKKRFERDPYFLGKTETKPLEGRGGDNSGADGLAITDKGDLYFGTFGSGRFYTMKRNAEGNYGKPELIFEDPKRFPCCDGICFDPAKNRIIMTDSALNAIHTWDVAKGEFGEMWRNGDTDGADGLLDQPCEPLIWKDADGKRKLIVCNFDMPFPGLTNTKAEAPYTLSVIDLD